MVTVSELIEFMSFILQKNEDGLAILVGAAPAPTALELYEMRCGGQVDYGVRYVEAAVARIILILLRTAVAVYVVAIKITCVDGFSISANREAPHYFLQF